MPGRDGTGPLGLGPCERRKDSCLKKKLESEEKPPKEKKQNIFSKK